MPAPWVTKAARFGLIWAWGSEWRGLRWRDDPTTTSRGPQFGNGYTGAVMGSPEFVVSLYCGSDDRAPIPPTDAFELKGWQVVAAAMDMETGAIERLWCPAGNCATVSGIQRTYAHEAIPHTVATSFSLSNTGASAVTVSLDAPELPKTVVGPAVGGASGCVSWGLLKSLSVQGQTFALLEAKNSDGSASLVISYFTGGRSASISIPASGTQQLSFVSSRCTTADSQDPLGQVTNETSAIAVLDAGTLFASHVKAYTARRFDGVGMDVVGNDRLARFVNASWHAMLNSAPRSELRSFGWGLGGLVTNGYNGRTFWDMDTWCAPNFLLLYPEVAKKLIEFRAATMDLGASCSKALGYEGADFPWDYTYVEQAPVPPSRCEDHTEIHLGGDISLSVYQYWQTTRDTAWLKQTGWKLLRGIAQFFVSRATKNLDGSYSFFDASGPDESGATNEKRRDPVYVCVVAKQSIRRAIELRGWLATARCPRRSGRRLPTRSGSRSTRPSSTTPSTTATNGGPILSRQTW